MNAAVPAHVIGSLAAADVQSPSQCTVVDAPYGIESAGPDAVIRIDGLVAGTAYIVRLTSTSDLAFYVATGCSTPSGPSRSEEHRVGKECRSRWGLEREQNRLAED